MPVSWAVCWLPRSDGPRGPSPACPHALDIARPCHGGLSTLLLIPTGRRRKLASSLASTAAYRRCCCCVCGARIALGQASRPLSGPSPRHVTRRFVLCAGRRWPPEPADATRRRVCAVLTLPVTGRGQAEARPRRLLSSPLLSSPLRADKTDTGADKAGQGRAVAGWSPHPSVSQPLRRVPATRPVLQPRPRHGPKTRQPGQHRVRISAPNPTSPRSLSLPSAPC